MSAKTRKGSLRMSKIKYICKFCFSVMFIMFIYSPGNMWAQQWNSLVNEFMPYKGKPSLDVTPEMVRQVK